MLKDYILGSEVAKKGNFSIANISMLLKDFDLIEGIDYLKYGGITLLNKKSLKMPNYIYKLLCDKSMTDLSEYIPYNYLYDIVMGNMKLIESKITKIKIENKQFVKINDEKLKNVIFNEKLVKSVVDNNEIKDLLNEKYILGYEKLSNTKSLCWY